MIKPDKANRETYNVSPADYAGHLAQAEEHNLNLWENHGWGIRTLEGDGDGLVWVAAYLLRSRPGGPFVREKFSALQSMIAHVEYTSNQRRRMNDNNFLALGFNGLEDLLPAEGLNISVEQDRAVWRSRDLRFIAQPPRWQVRGTDGHVEYDLELKADTPAFWLTDPAKTALENGDRWHLINARAEGSISLNGQKMGLSGMGWHERHIHLNDYYNPVRLLRGKGVLFHNGYALNLHVHMMGRPDLNIMKGKILYEDKEYNFKKTGTISIDEIRYWVDPRSRLSVPVEWILRMDDGVASLELHVQAFARTFYLWNFLSGGVNILYWWLAEAYGHFHPPGERKIAITDMKHVVHQNQVFYAYGD